MQPSWRQWSSSAESYAQRVQWIQHTKLHQRCVMAFSHRWLYHTSLGLIHELIRNIFSIFANRTHHHGPNEKSCSTSSNSVPSCGLSPGNSECVTASWLPSTHATYSIPCKTNQLVLIPLPHPMSTTDFTPIHSTISFHNEGEMPLGSKLVNPPRCGLSPLPP